MFSNAINTHIQSDSIGLLKGEQHVAQGVVDFFCLVLELPRSCFLDHQKQVLKERLTA